MGNPHEVANYYFPIIVVDYVNEKPVTKNVQGTAFSIGNDFFLTAAHVIEAFSEYDEVLLGYHNYSTGNYHSVPIEKYEIYSDLDIGIVYAKMERKCKPHTLRWSEQTLAGLQNVTVFGYPFAFDNSSNTISRRMFKGYIISETEFTRLPNNPRCYELSIHCARGISGAALLSRNLSEVSVRGVVIGTQNVEIEIYKDIEIEESTNEKTINSKMETVMYGIAIHSKEIVAIKFDLLGMTLGEYLIKNKLIIK